MNKIVESEIINKIKSGDDSQILIKDYHLSYSMLHKLSKKYNVLNEFKLNNKKRQSNNVQLKIEKSHREINENINNIYGEEITKLVIEKKFSTYDIRKKLNIPQKKLIRFLKYKNLYNICIDNGKFKKSEIAKINGKLSSLKLKGIELKPITTEIIEKFEFYKQTLVYKQKVYDVLKKDFNFGDKKIKQLCERCGYPKDNPQSGRLNPMYGKSPSKKSGIGVKCHLKVNGNLYFCRSSLELKIFLYLIENNIKFIPSKHRIKYKINNIDKTYCPDIIIDNTIICEIKPHSLITNKENIVKMESLNNYCNLFKLQCQFLTEKCFDLEKYSDIKIYENLISNGTLIIDSTNLEKLKRNI